MATDIQIQEEKEHFMIMHLDCPTRDSLLETMSIALEEKGFVKNTFLEAVLAREKEFPTGLPTNGVGIAIPHTDCIHVLKKGIGLGILKQPLDFHVMGSNSDLVSVQIVFMLALDKPQAQLEMLEKLINMCQNEEILTMIRDYIQVEKINALMESMVQ